MDKVSVTELRNNLYRIIDEVITTGCPQEVVRNGYTLKIILENHKGKRDKLSNLKPHHTLKCNADEIINMKVGQWQEEENL